MKLKKFILFLILPFLLVIIVGLSFYQGMIFNPRLIQFQFILLGGTISFIFAINKSFGEPSLTITSILLILLNIIIYGFDLIGIILSILVVGVIYVYFKFMSARLGKLKVKIFKYLIFASLLILVVLVKGLVIYLSVKTNLSEMISFIKIEILYVAIIGFVSALGFDIADLLEERYLKYYE